MPAPPRWLLAVPDAIRQLETLDRDLLTRRDVERLFGVSKGRAVALMTAFGAGRTGHLLTLPRAALLRQLRRHRTRVAFRGAKDAVGRLFRARPGADARLRAVRGARRGGRGGRRRGSGEGMSDDLVRVEPSDARRPARAASTARLVLPPLIVDAGPVAVARFSGVLRRADREPAHARGVRAGRGAVPGVVRGAGPGAHGGLAAARGGLHPDPPRVRRPPSKQHLAAIRMLGDWLVVSQVIPVNPAAAVRGPTHVVTTGATPVRSPAEASRLLAAIDTGTLAGLRDRALVSVILYSVARVSAVIGMRRQDYFRQERQGWLRLHEKGGTRHDVPAHHRAAEALDDYLARAGLDEAKAALFQSVDPAGRRLTGRALSRRLVLAMITRRAAAADLPPSTCCHTRSLWSARCSAAEAGGQGSPGSPGLAMR